jgi:hypothetical protein
MAVYMPYLQDECRRLGVTFREQEVTSLTEAAALAKQWAGIHGEPVIVNCTGIGARKLCNDDRVGPQYAHDTQQRSFAGGSWYITTVVNTKITPPLIRGPLLRAGAPWAWGCCKGQAPETD